MSWHRPPPLPGGTISRRRLLELFDGAGSYRLVLVAGPPGSGKSVLLSDWVGHLPPGSYAWITASEALNQVEAFWTNIAVALDQLGLGTRSGPEIESSFTEGDTSNVLLAPHDPDGGDPRYLVIDDAHVLRDHAVRRALLNLVEHGPPWLHLVLATRADPAMPLHRMRAQGAVIEIRDADLRFSSAETASFLELAGLGSLSADQVAVLEHRTEGWPAGLQLAALSLRRVNDPDGFLEHFAGTNRHIADYLIHEVLDHQPEDIYWFLLRTAPFDLLTPGLCAAVSGEAEAGAYLELLEREHLFISRLDATSEIYRYHELFRELLQFVLRSRHPNEEPKILAAAAEWHDSHGDHRQAIDEWLGAGAISRAVDAMTANAEQYFDDGHPDVIRRWTSATPELVLAEDVWVVLGHAARLGWANRREEQAHCLDRADELLDGHDDPDARLVADVLSGFADLASSELTVAKGRLLGAVGRIDWDNASHSPSDAVYASARRADLGLSYAEVLLGDTASARTTLDRSTGRHPGEPAASVQVRSILALADLFDGRLRAAARRVDNVAADMVAFGLSGPSQETRQLLSVISGWLLFERNDLEGALEDFDEHLRNVQEESGPTAILAALGIIEVNGAMGAVDEAISRLDRLRRLHRNLADPVALAWIDAVEARQLLAAGQVPGAQKLAADLPQLSQFSGVRADVDLAAGDLDSARERFAGPVMASPRHRIEAAVVSAAASMLETGAAPPEVIGEIVRTGEEEGYLRTVLRGGPAVITALLDDTSVSGTPYAAELRKHHDETPADFATSGHLAGLIEPLSDRERQVLRYLPTRLSSREIGAELYVSVNTVKTHMQAIYRKLGCNTRKDAVDRARALRMLT